MSQLQKIQYSTPEIKIINVKAHTQYKPIITPFSHLQNAEELSHQKMVRNSNALDQKTFSLSNAQLINSYEKSIQELENRLSDQNRYLRQSTYSTITQLQSAHETIKKMQIQRQNLEKKNTNLIKQLETKNNLSKDVLDGVDKIKKQNVSLRLQIDDLTSIIKQIKGENSSRTLQVTKNNKQEKLPHQKYISKQSSLTHSKRSNSRSNFIAPELSPKQSARMEILYDQVESIKSKLIEGQSLSYNLANKLLSLITHLTSTLNHRNDEIIHLKSRLKQYQQMFITTQHNQYRTLNNSYQDNPLTINSFSHKYNKSTDRLRKPLQNSWHAPSKNTSINEISKYYFDPRQNYKAFSRTPSIDLIGIKYNNVTRRIQLQDYLRKGITGELSVDIMKKMYDLIQKQCINSPRQLNVKDFYISYSEGNQTKIKLALKPKYQNKQTLLVTQMIMMKSLGIIFNEILKSINIDNPKSEKLFKQQIKPSIHTIINSLIAQQSQRLSMGQLKILLQMLNYY